MRAKRATAELRQGSKRFTHPRQSELQLALAGSSTACRLFLDVTSSGPDESLRIDNLRFGAAAFCDDAKLSSGAPFALDQSPTPDGTAARPYPICNVAQLQTVANTTTLWSKNFILKQDIDLSTLVGQVGNDTTSFLGTFDGEGHELRNTQRIT